MGFALISQKFLWEQAKDAIGHYIPLLKHGSDEYNTNLQHIIRDRCALPLTPAKYPPETLRFERIFSSLFTINALINGRKILRFSSLRVSSLGLKLPVEPRRTMF